MRSESVYVYDLDADDRIVSVGPGWDAFALANGAPELSASAVVGRPLFDFVAGAEARHLYRALFAGVRRGGRMAVVPFRCDGPAVRRFMELRIRPGEVSGALALESEILREEPREHVSLLDARATRSRAYLLMCSWCKRLQVHDGWLEVEPAAALLRLFDGAPLPQLSHGICGDCDARLAEEIGELR